MPANLGNSAVATGLEKSAFIPIPKKGSAKECSNYHTVALILVCGVPEELYKKDLHNPDNHDGMITHLESDILECKVKLALGSITTHKTSGSGGILAELFQIIKDDAVQVLHSTCQQI